jgi:hypothetical protein
MMRAIATASRYIWSTGRAEGTHHNLHAGMAAISASSAQMSAGGYALVDQLEHRHPGLAQKAGEPEVSIGQP